MRVPWPGWDVTMFFPLPAVPTVLTADIPTYIHATMVATCRLWHDCH